MKYLKLSNALAILVIGALVFTSCKKVTTVTSIGDAGQTLVKILGGGTPAVVTKMPVDFVSTPTTLLAVELRRDIPSPTELNKTMIVTVKDDLAAVTAANPAYIQLPTAWYTIQTAGIKTGGQGGTYTFTFAPGEFSKEIYIIIPNATLLDPSSLYALGFTIQTADAAGVISTQKSKVIEIGAKNIYDGQYDMWGVHNRVPYNFPYHVTMNMVTTGASSVIFWWPDVGGVGHPIGTGPDPVGDVSWYGSTVAPEVVFNPATNFVTDVHGTNPAGPPISIYTGAGSGQGRFETGTKKMYVYWRYNANDLRGFMDTLTYIGSR